ncbi:ATP-binding protein [Phenylobacterium sp.]|uniref:ATP-binding protein n=1 Tax=Phenylobacterium sp. TaxID=1871053 RepID=UPI0035AFB500
MTQKGATLALGDLSIAMAVLDEDHMVVEANDAFASLLGCKDRSCEGKRLGPLLEAAGAQVVNHDMGKVYRLLEDDGVVHTYQLSIHPRRDGALAVLLDVTPAEVRLGMHGVMRDARELLMREAEIGAWRYDPDQDVYYFPSEITMGHGDVGKPVPTQVLQLVQHRDDQAVDTQIRERITRHGGSAEAEIRYRAADGGWNHVRVLYRAGARTPSGRFEMFGVSQNITSMARARDEAKANALRLELALKVSRAGVFEFDFKTRSFWRSAEFDSLVGEGGFTEGDANPLGLRRDEDFAAISAMWDQACASSAEAVDVRLGEAESERWVRVYFEVERNEAGEPRRGVGLIIDIDESKRQELALDEARRLAEEATVAKSDFLASVSHEIRTPMNGVVGVLNLLEREPLTGEGKHLVAEALGCAEMLGQLINDVLDFSKIEAGKLTLSPAPTDVRAIVESVAGLLRPQAEAKGLYLRAEVEDGLGWVDVDPVRLRQCLFNIVGNAVKFTEKGGVAVKVRRLGEGAAAKLRFEVRDTGVGIPESARGKLFDRFQQVDGGAGRRFGGTGLGLAISRQLTLMMGGDLDYDSCEGEGSTFWFEVSAPPAVAQAAVADGLGEAPLEGLQVLVVDDNRVNRIVGVKTLEALGACAEAVESGHDAVEAVRTGDFDLILMDVNMPGMDGLEATRRIRADGFRGAILALTADVMRRQEEAYLAAGMNGMAPKPFSPASLLAEIARLAAERPARVIAGLA